MHKVLLPRLFRVSETQLHPLLHYKKTPIHTDSEFLCHRLVTSPRAICPFRRPRQADCQFQSLLYQGNPSDQIFPRTRLGLATGAFQSLLYQGNPSDQDVRRLIEAREGVNFSPNTARSGYWRVSIPSLSGQSFRHRCGPWHRGSFDPRFNPFFIRAILPTLTTAPCAVSGEMRFNPFFIRAILPTKFFPEHGSVWLLARFNPFFIRAILPT
jgi:hypothetical protein